MKKTQTAGMTGDLKDNIFTLANAIALLTGNIAVTFDLQILNIQVMSG